MSYLIDIIDFMSEKGNFMNLSKNIVNLSKFIDIFRIIASSRLFHRP